MNIPISVLLSTLGIAALSGIGIALVKILGARFDRILLTLVALSAGAMFGNAMFHVLPESIEVAQEDGTSLFSVLALVTAGFVGSFFFEQVTRWHHCHSSSHHGDQKAVLHCHVNIRPAARLLLLSDAAHNFVDGLIISAAFTVSPALGISTAAAVALHEVPQEIGDYAVLVHGGYRKARAFWLNLLSASTVVGGGIVGLWLSSGIENAVGLLLPLAAGSFLYIASSDLLPELKHEERPRETFLHFVVFLSSLALMAVFALNE